MKSELDYSILQKTVNALASCEAEGFFTDISPHLRDHFLIPLLRGKSVSIGDLDFSQFDGSDIDGLQDGAEQLADMLQRIQRTAEQAVSVPCTAKALVPFL